MIVAVDDFNMGAMENKGLNVFNSKYVLASPETATDADYKGIEAIIAHEYFHNWTGNRITCRDWFQLCLKEGLTVFRDQQFSGDSAATGVKRIEDVIAPARRAVPRGRGPARPPGPPRPTTSRSTTSTPPPSTTRAPRSSRMLRRLVGPETYAPRARPLFRAPRRPGRAPSRTGSRSSRTPPAATSPSSSSGTPRPAPRASRPSERWNGGRYSPDPRARRRRRPPASPTSRRSSSRSPSACSRPDGAALAEGVLEFDRARATLQWDLPDRPVAVAAARLLRAGRSSTARSTPEDRAFLLAHDATPSTGGRPAAPTRSTLLGRLATDPTADVDAGLSRRDDGRRRRRRARSGLPGARARPALRRRHHRPHRRAGRRPRSARGPPRPPRARRPRSPRRSATAADDLYAANAVPGPYSPDAEAAGHRALRARALALLTARDPDATAANGPVRRRRQHDRAHDRPRRSSSPAARPRTPSTRFHADWGHDRLVVDKWFAVQASLTPPETAVATVSALTRHPDFDWRNPNRFRSLIGAFASANPAGFHRGGWQRIPARGRLADELDPVNPQTTARLAATLGSWRMFDDEPPGADARRAASDWPPAGPVARHRRDRRPSPRRGRREGAACHVGVKVTR